MNDIVLHVAPFNSENGRLSERVSRRHAVLQFEDQGVYWHNLNCGHGTLTSQQGLIESGQAIRLAQRSLVSPAAILGLRCNLFSTLESSWNPAYERFARSHGAELPSQAGREAAVYLQREDGLAEREGYLLFQRAFYIGRAKPNCALHIDDPSVEPIHAQVLNLAGMLWLETLTRNATEVDGRPLPLNCLAQLRPYQKVRVGEVEIIVMPYFQELADNDLA